MDPKILPEWRRHVRTWVRREVLPYVDWEAVEKLKNTTDWTALIHQEIDNGGFAGPTKKKYHNIVEDVENGKLVESNLVTIIKTEISLKKSTARRIQYREHEWKLIHLPFFHLLGDIIYGRDWNIARVHPKDRGNWIAGKLL